MISKLGTYTLYIYDPVSAKSPRDTNKFHESFTSCFSSFDIVTSAILSDVQPILFSAVKNRVHLHSFTQVSLFSMQTKVNWVQTLLFDCRFHFCPPL